MPGITPLVSHYAARARKAGYGDEEFPNWWYSPVDDTSVHEDDVKTDVDARRDVSDDVVTRTVPSGDE